MILHAWRCDGKLPEIDRQTPAAGNSAYKRMRAPELAQHITVPVGAAGPACMSGSEHADREPQLPECLRR